MSRASSSSSLPPETTGGAKRRARGQLRIESLLAAAEDVFAEVGFDGATTNLIAARASASPGTLYQFFENKTQMAEVIAHRYAEQLTAIHAKVFDPVEHSSAAEAIDNVTDAFLRFLRSAPAYGALLVTTGISEELSALRSLLVGTAIHGIAEVIAKFAPHLSKADQTLHSEVCVMVSRGMVPMLQTKNLRQRARAESELKQVIRRYLAPLVARESRKKK